MIRDPYMHALDHPGLHDLPYRGGKGYKTLRFSRSVYEESRGKRFAGRNEAYLDWLEYGREAGLTYAEGADTCLKLLLKASDEPELLVKWIDYHSAVVGPQNLVVIDCGSKDPDYLALLERISRDIVVFRYTKYYNRIHKFRGNRALYAMLRQNCRYLSVLDADEFIFGYSEGAISGHNVLDVLRSDDLDFHAGIWFENAEPLPRRGDGLDFGGGVRFLLDDASIRKGAVFGKSVVRTSALDRALYIGHNLQTPDTVALARPASLGRIGVLHLRKLGASISLRRAVRHQRALGNLAEDAAVPAALEARYKARFSAADPGLKSFTTRILDPSVVEANADFARAIEAFDFGAVLSAQRAAFATPAAKAAV